ncbi:lambda family phage minor tail protein L [Rahnella sp. JUb53]|uniref:phage minor tail protein L n=1 Tax=Rahnella sp. JUb53 TaxID=2485128 RepID=UPI000E6BFEFA|nr:phage minor tail protein L [Rahnella sp. JUb53]TCQ91589.1 lambda family phage minor tail protein L [Rahnella sp. JUb53]
MSFNQDIQQLEPGSLIQLVEIDGTAFGLDKILRFHAYNISSPGWKSFAVEHLPSIIWQGNEYDPHPYEVKGLELSSTGAQPTPSLSVGNVGNYVTALCIQYQDMVKAKVKIHTTLLKYLDAANWQQGNPDANPREERVQLFYVNAKTAETRIQVDFELCSPFDVQSLQLPSRQITPLCTWCMRGLYRSGTGCDYNDTNYFAKDGTPTNDPSKDQCGGRRRDCEDRFGKGNPLSFGGFPGANLQGK